MAEFTDCSGYYVPAEVDEKIATLQAEIDEYNLYTDELIGLLKDAVNLIADNELRSEMHIAINKHKQEKE